MCVCVCSDGGRHCLHSIFCHSSIASRSPLPACAASRLPFATNPARRAMSAAAVSSVSVCSVLLSCLFFANPPARLCFPSPLSIHKYCFSCHHHPLPQVFFSNPSMTSTCRALFRRINSPVYQVFVGIVVLPISSLAAAQVGTVFSPLRRPS